MAERQISRTARSIIKTTFEYTIFYCTGLQLSTWTGKLYHLVTKHFTSRLHLVSRGPDSHTPGRPERVWSNSYTFSRSVLTRQQRAPLIKKPVTGRHESVEIIYNASKKMSILKFETMCFLLSAREVLDDVPTIFHGFPEQNGYRSLTRLSPGVWDSGPRDTCLPYFSGNQNSTVQFCGCASINQKCSD